MWPTICTLTGRRRPSRAAFIHGLFRSALQRVSVTRSHLIFGGECSALSKLSRFEILVMVRLEGFSKAIYTYSPKLQAGSAPPRSTHLKIRNMAQTFS